MRLDRDKRRFRGAISVGTMAAIVISVTAACSSSPSSSATTAPNASASKAEISKSYQTLFNMSDKSVAPKVAVVQDGKSLQSAFSAELSSPLAAEASGAKVDSVQILSSVGCKAEFLPSPCASVSYEIVLPAMSTGNLTGLKGFAVYQGGKWLVSKQTICALFTLASNNVAPKGC